MNLFHILREKRRARQEKKLKKLMAQAARKMTLYEFCEIRGEHLCRWITACSRTKISCHAENVELIATLFVLGHHRDKKIGEVALERKLDGTFNLNVAPHILHRGRIFFGRNAGDWITGDFMHGELQQQYYHHYDLQYRALINGVPVEADTVSRYIGRVDQYKNPVFEGDLIVQYVSLDGEIVAEKSLIEYSDETCGFVKKLLSPFSKFFVDDIPSQEEFSKEIEVIGNKWDNPELLEAISKGGSAND